MASSRRVDPNMWRDGWVSALEKDERYLWMYLVANSSMNNCGIYQIPLKIVHSDTDIDLDYIVKSLEKFENDGKAKYSNGWIALKNFFKIHPLNKNMKINAARELRKAPKDMVMWVFDNSQELYERVLKELKSGGDIYKLLLKEDEGLLLPDEDDDEQQDDLVKDEDGDMDEDGRVVELPADAIEMSQFLYDKIMERERPTKYLNNPPNLLNWAKYIERINRLDGYSWDEITEVIDWCTRDRFWMGNILSGKSLRKQFMTLKSRMNCEAGKFGAEARKRIDEINEKWAGKVQQRRGSG